MNYLINIVIFLSLLNSQSMDTLWTKSIDIGGDSNIPYNIISTSDDNYIAVGTTNAFSINGENLLLIKFDNNGDTLWFNHYENFGYDDWFYPNIIEIENIYYLCARSIIMAINNDGELLWQNNYDNVWYFRGINKTSNNELILTGTEYTYFDGSNKFILYKISTNGDVIWSYYSYNWHSTSEGADIIEDSEGNYNIAGKHGGGCDNQIWRKFSPDGESIHDTQYGCWGYGNSISEKFDGGFIIGGNELRSISSDYGFWNWELPYQTIYAKQILENIILIADSDFIKMINLNGDEIETLDYSLIDENVIIKDLVFKDNKVFLVGTKLNSIYLASININTTGCTDINACNYYETANVDDGSCEYPVGLCDCDGSGEGIDGFNCDWSCEGVVGSFGYCCTVLDECGACLGIESIYSDYECVTGCTDTEASNYNPNANVDDGSCMLVFQPQTKEELQTAVDLWVSYNETALETYGDISEWDTSLITDMSELFRNTFYGFSGDISSWDVSNVTDMSYMLSSIWTQNISQDLSNWDVSNVTDMSYMFYDSDHFNGNISSWDVSSVTDMSNMFNSVNDFNGNLSNWDVSSVTDMNRMFYWADNFNQDLVYWDVSNVTNMNYMFWGGYDFNGDLSSWNVSSVTTMYGMFFKAGLFNQDISSWDVSNVTNMGMMFYEAQNFNQSLSLWNVSSVTDMNNMFNQAMAFNQDLSNWDVSNVTNMNGMFKQAVAFNQDLASWDVSNVIEMNWIFGYLDSFNQDLSNWDISNVTDTRHMFSNALSFNQDISAWDVSNIIYMDGMFDNTPNLLDEYKCLIHSSWSYNENWPYDWLGLCVLGCTDSEADNYNPDAGSDDGSCLYCNDNQFFNGEECLFLQFYGEAGGFEIDTKNPEVILFSPNQSDTLAIGSTLDIIWTASDDRFGDTPITLSYAGEELVTENSGSAEVILPDNPTYGFNFSVTATDFYGNSSTDLSDETFVLDYFGCTNELADNYDANAVFESENCTYSDIISVSIGNNLISFPGQTNPQVTSGLMENYENQSGGQVNFILGQGQGLFKIEDGWSGNLTEINPYSGYWMNVSSSYDWSVSLTGISDQCMPYDIGFGNNLLSYVGEHGQETVEALGGPIQSALYDFILGQGQGLFRTADNWSGNLTSLYSGKGYWLNSNVSNSAFQWGTGCENAEPVAKDNIQIELPEEFRFTQSTNQAFYLIEEIEIDGKSPEENDIVLAYHNDVLIGSALWDEELTVLPIMGRDMSSQTEGFIENGEIPQLKLYQSFSCAMMELQAELLPFENLLVYTVDKLSGRTIELPSEVQLYSPFPNPFNPITNIRFGLPEETHIKLEIYNIKGELIESLIIGNQPAGFHTLTWDAMNVSSGVYFVKLTTDKFSQSQKLMVVK